VGSARPRLDIHLPWTAAAQHPHVGVDGDLVLGVGEEQLGLTRHDHPDLARQPTAAHRANDGADGSDGRQFVHDVLTLGRRIVIAIRCLLAALAALLAVAPLAVPASAGADRTAANPLTVGVTVDDTSHLAAVIAAERHLGRTVATRLVMNVDRAHPAAVGRYLRPAERLAAVGPVMAELVDSSELRRISVPAIRRRTRAALATLGGSVSVWEIGNEVNGSWTSRRGTVAAKVRAAYRIVHRAGRPTALTLYDDIGCGDGPGEQGPVRWSRSRLGTGLRSGLDYVLLSYYETQCHDRRPSAAAWTELFRRLHALFPNARIGFGEIGLPKRATSGTRATARSIIRRYYRLDLHLPYVFAGCFYWYFAEDMVPWRRSPLYPTLRRAVRR
jgi:hypothetical protein